MLHHTNLKRSRHVKLFFQSGGPFYCTNIQLGQEIYTRSETQTTLFLKQRVIRVIHESDVFFYLLNFQHSSHHACSQHLWVNMIHLFYVLSVKRSECNISTGCWKQFNTLRCLRPTTDIKSIHVVNILLSNYINT